MDCLLEISYRGRALGIYLILSILRPDAKTVDSRLKAMLNATMGFKAKSRINANVIGTPGAENLEGEGHFFLDSITVKDMPEIKALFLDEDRLQELLEPYNEYTQKKGREGAIEAEWEDVDETTEPLCLNEGKPTEKDIFDVL
jgi:S-DNA-T family DNA segregation ATPase FtsK/SpoIIIE